VEHDYVTDDVTSQWQMTLNATELTEREVVAAESDYAECCEVPDCRDARTATYSSQSFRFRTAQLR